MVMAEILDTIFSKAPYPKTSMTIITPYNAQRALYLEYLNGLKQRTGLPFTELPRIKTIDSMQGHESDIVLLDWVNLYGDRLGFLDDNRRINVALSRAHASLIVFFSHGTSNEIYKPRKRKHKGSSPPMEVTNHWDWLVQRGFDIEVPAKEDGWAGIFTASGEEHSAVDQQPDAEPEVSTNANGDQQTTSSGIDAETAGAWEKQTGDQGAAFAMAPGAPGSWEQEAALATNSLSAQTTQSKGNDGENDVDSNGEWLF